MDMNQAFRTITIADGRSLWVGSPIRVLSPDRGEATPAYGLFCVLEAWPGEPSSFPSVRDEDGTTVGKVLTVAEAVAAEPAQGMEIIAAARALVFDAVAMAKSLQRSLDPEDIDRRVYVQQYAPGFARDIRQADEILGRQMADKLNNGEQPGTSGFEGLG